MLNSIIELNQKELSLISGGENDLTTDGVNSTINSTVKDIGNNASAQQSYSEQALAVAYASGEYLWYAGEAALAVLGALVVGVVGVTSTCVILKKCRHPRKH